jgi:hypothetical protein
MTTYFVKIANPQMEEYIISANTPIEAATKASKMAVVELIPTIGQACNDIRVTWNHKTVTSCESEDIFNGLLKKQESYEYFDYADFWWDENGITLQNDEGSMFGEHE